MQVLTLPADWDGYPEHNHASNAFDPDQEELYIPLSGSGTLVAGEDRFDLVPGRWPSSVGAMELLLSAASGNEQAFVQLALRRRLHVHCYRMLGSVRDADDALQKTMLRAWRCIGRFEPRAELSA
jgi:Sigma-70 region 2